MKQNNQAIVMILEYIESYYSKMKKNVSSMIRGFSIYTQFTINLNRLYIKHVVKVLFWINNKI